MLDDVMKRVFGFREHMTDWNVRNPTSSAAVELDVRSFSLLFSDSFSPSIYSTVILYCHPPFVDSLTTQTV